jgi:hypothetical protein
MLPDDFWRLSDVIEKPPCCERSQCDGYSLRQHFYWLENRAVLLTQAVRVPITKCKISEITASTSNR